MTWGLAWFVSLALLLMPPVMEGKATWYQDFTNPRCLMRNGTLFDPQAMTCAVDDLRFDEFVTETVTVCTSHKCIQCVVTDSGYLADAGVVLDLSPAAFRLLVGPLGVGVAEVGVWVQ